MSLALSPTPSTGRIPRRPQHQFALKIRPWQIQPFLLAPVLPGETLKNLLIQMRAVSKPVRAALTGWWLETYIFYVKHRDLTDRDTLVTMALDPSTTLSALNTVAASTALYSYANTVHWSSLCLRRVVEEYFRDQGETWNTQVLDTIPIAQLGNTSFMESATLNSAMPAEDTIAAGSGVGTIERLQEVYEWMRQQKLINLTYEDWLATYGVRMHKEEPHKPELLRYVREWTYPANTVDPTTGTPSSALSWSIAERADKDRFFKEPGFVFGVVIARPKVYRKNQAGSAAGMMVDALTWLPAMTREDFSLTLKKFTSGTGPLSTISTDYWLDIKDLLIYGDQFINFANTATDANIINVPTTTLVHKYASSADADSLFTAASPANTVQIDGVCSMNILGAQFDTT